MLLSYYPHITSGIGAVPDAVLDALGNHKNLGIHTEMFSDGVLKLVECNAITNAEKTLHTGKVSFSIRLNQKLSSCLQYLSFFSVMIVDYLQ